MTIEGHSAASNKWIQNLGKPTTDDGDEFGEWPLSQEEEKKVAQVVEQSAPETPRKAIKASPFMTPGSKRKRDEDSLPTPATGNSDDVFITPSTTRLKGGMWDGNERLGLRSPSQTPTPSRFRDVSVDPNNSHNGYDITNEVMSLLRDQRIDEETTSNLRELLNKHALKISGIAKGRDITRLALKSKDAKIAELQQKITRLETEREMDKTVIRHFKSDMAQNVGPKNGKARGP